METVAVVGRKPLRIMGLRKSKQEREGAVGLPSHQGVDDSQRHGGRRCGRTKAGLRPAARQERRQKHRTEQEPACFLGIKINIFPAAWEEGMEKMFCLTIQQCSIPNVIPYPDAESPDKHGYS